MHRFSSWEEASGYYIKKLEHALDVQRHAMRLARLPQIEPEPGSVAALEKDKDALAKQLNRLKAGEFRIAVVGMESAGKSTFVNAWLEYELLPSESERCTYTTTQIESVTDASEQRVEVETKTSQELAEEVQNLRQVSGREGDVAERAREDLAAIERFRKELDEIVDTEIEPLDFARFEDIEKDLRRYVANEKYAHGVKEVRIYTSELASTDGVVFFDVPGLNSGFAKHIEETQQMLRDCDAVICIQKVREPSLTGPEKKLIEFIREGEVEGVGIDNKLFVFLAQADTEATAQGLESDVDKARLNWKERGDLKKDKIVAGSAGAFLVLANVANSTTLEALGDREVVKERIGRLFHIPDAASDSEYLEATGITPIKERVSHYLENERVGVLRKRCDKPTAEILAAARKLYEQSRKRFPEDPEEAKRKANEETNVQFSEWWETEWITIKAQLKRYFQKHFASSEVDTDERSDDGSEGSSVERLKSRYDTLVEQQFSNLTFRGEERREELFDATAVRGENVTQLNIQWREKLFEDISTAIEKIAHELSMELLGEIEQLVEAMTDMMWGVPEIETRLLGAQVDYQGELEIGLKTLFLRFARPVNKALIQAPKGSDLRDEVLRELGRDIDLLDNFYSREEVEYSRVKRFVRFGRELFDDPIVRMVILNIEPRAEIAAEVLERLDDEESPEIPEPKVAQTKEEVVEEVEADLDALEEYLKHAVFDAAGFAAYRIQELRRMRDRFVEEGNNGRWKGVAMNAWTRRNPRLIQLLPESLKSREVDTEISKQIRQLRISLQNNWQDAESNRSDEA